MFLHYVLQLRDDEMLFQFFDAQWKCPSRNDWVLTVQQDFVDLDLEMTLSEIKSFSKDSFKVLVKEKCQNAALTYLLRIKEGHSKLTALTYDKLELQPYLNSSTFSSLDAQLLFRFRTRMIKVACNYKNNNVVLNCPLCNNADDDQKHLLSCEVLHPDGPSCVNYNDIFCSDVDKMKIVLDVLKNAWLLRDQILEDSNELTNTTYIQ